MNNSYRWIIGVVIAGMILAGMTPAQNEAPAVATKSASVRFREAYGLLLDADRARDAGRTVEAVELYQAAQTYYLKLSAQYPDWERGVTRFRIAYCADQLDAFKTRPAGTSTNLPSALPLIPKMNAQEPSSTPLPAQAVAPSVDVAAIIREGRRLIEAGEGEDAWISLREALKAEPDNPTVRMLMATAQCRCGNFDDAVGKLSELVSERPKDPTARLLLASAYFGLGALPEAKAELLETLKLAPDSEDAHFNLAQVLLGETPPDISGAREHYDRYRKLGGKADEGLDSRLKTGSEDRRSKKRNRP